MVIGAVNESFPACTARNVAVAAMGFEMLHAWNRVFPSPFCVVKQCEDIVPLSRIAMEAAGVPRVARTSAANEQLVFWKAMIFSKSGIKSILDQVQL